MRALLRKLWHGLLWCLGIVTVVLLIAVISAVDESDARRTSQQAADRLGYILDSRTNLCYAVYAPKPENDKEIRLVAVPCSPEVLRIARRR